MDDLLLKKLKSEYQYLKTEKEYQEQIFKKAEQKFKDHFNPKLGIQEPKPQKKQPKKKPKIRTKRLNRLYKKLAQKIHPDKKTGDTEDFRKLKKSVDDNDIDTMMDLADEYNIDIEVEVNQKDILLGKIERLKNK